MSRLTSKQRAHLRSLAHSLSPVLQIGAGGVSDAFLTSLDEAFHNRELLKVKVVGTSDLSVKEGAQEVGRARPAVEVVQTVGHVMVLYQPFPDEPEIELP